MPPDYHMHTPLCRHAVGEPTDYAARALQAGLTEIGFSDHNPMLRDDFDDWRMRISDLDQYLQKVRQAQETHPSLTIKFALEVDYLPGHEDWIRQLTARFPWDYLIGSVHYVSDEWDIDNPKKLGQWKERDAFTVWREYFRRLTMAAESKLFDIIGHADLPKKFCFYPKEDCTGLYEEFLTAAANNGVAVELNTAGLRKECKEIYPNRTLLQIAHRNNVPITFGSDAHAPEEVGWAFREAIHLARSVGYTHCCRFTGRRRSVISF